MASDFTQSLVRSVRILRAEFTILNVLGGRDLAVQPKRRPMFHLVLEGGGWLVDDASRTRTQLQTGDYLFVFNDQPHRIQTEGAAEVDDLAFFDRFHDDDVPSVSSIGKGPLQLRLLSGALELDLAASPFLPALPNILLVNSAERRESFDEKRSQQLVAAMRSAGASTFLTRMIDLYLVDALRHSSPQVYVSGEDVLSSRRLTQITASVRLMASEPGQRWSVASLAKRANMSRSAFASAFHAAVGQPPLTYLRELRMQRASQLLRERSCSIKEVGFRMGYESEVSFARAFRKYCGRSPAEYRRSREHQP